MQPKPRHEKKSNALELASRKPIRLARKELVLPWDLGSIESMLLFMAGNKCPKFMDRQDLYETHNGLSVALCLSLIT